MRTTLLLVSLLSALFILPAAVPMHRESASTHIRPTHPQPEITIAAAADLRFAMDSLIKAYAAAQPGSPHITAVYGSSGNFFEQISNGAPFDIFFSADLDYPQKLAQNHKTIGDIKTYATGQIVLYSKKLDPAKTGINTLLDPAVSRIAIANPAHAPYGKRAEETLRYYKLYDQVKDKLVFGENISQTAEFARSGAADLGIIALSLALSPAFAQAGGKYYLIPASSHQPLRQAYVLLQHASNNPAAAKFGAFIDSPAARNILKQFGFAE